MPEYRESRCCMCPNANNPESRVCQPNPPHRLEFTFCRFVKRYIDKRGWKYKVRAGLGGDTYSCFYQKPEKTGDLGWKSMKNMPWHNSFDQAQSDLNALAKKKGWDERGVIP